MADYDSDSSGAGDVVTNVVLGFASKEVTDEPFSQLGGHPTWLDDQTPPSATLAKCRVCNGFLNLLLQIRGDIGEFPTHERRLYIWACRKKTCRRKEGSIRAVRATRHNGAQEERSSASVSAKDVTSPNPTPNLGETLFGVKSSSNSQGNPFASPSSSNASSNPFSASTGHSNPFAAAASSLAAKAPQNPGATDTLASTFAQKARISEPMAQQQSPGPVPRETWPPATSFPAPYPSYSIEPDKEYINPDPVPSNNTRVDRDAMDTSGGGGDSSAADDKTLFESSMDKTFQKFADRLAQNPEQILRYEYGGQPLLYSKTDAVGKLLGPAQDSAANSKVRVASGAGGSKFPRCGSCGAQRLFELQLTPHAITELEADEDSLDGMDWGTVILGVCSKDCQKSERKDGEVGYVEEWVGVQWEELASGKRPA